MVRLERGFSDALDHPEAGFAGEARTRERLWLPLLPVTCWRAAR